MRTLGEMFTHEGSNMKPRRWHQFHEEFEIRELVGGWATGKSIILPAFTRVEECDTNGRTTRLLFHTPRGMKIVATVICGEKISVDFEVTEEGETYEGCWFAWVTCGGDPAPARGPFRSIEEAEEALARFRERHGYLAGTYEAAGSLRLQAYPTREKARGADISDDGKIVRR